MGPYSIFGVEVTGSHTVSPLLALSMELLAENLSWRCGLVGAHGAKQKTI